MQMRLKPSLGGLLVGCLLVVGCGTSDSQLHHLSGKVTFNGQPLPKGRIVFLPDTTKGNSGPGGFAEINDGAYDTRTNGAPGPGGALIVQIEGFDGKTTAANRVGKPLFLGYGVKVDVPRANATQDFDVPIAAAKTLPKAGEEAP
jgi:hypothetical protein